MNRKKNIVVGFFFLSMCSFLYAMEKHIECTQEQIDDLLANLWILPQKAFDEQYKPFLAAVITKSFTECIRKMEKLDKTAAAEDLLHVNCLKLIKHWLTRNVLIESHFNGKDIESQCAKNYLTIIINRLWYRLYKKSKTPEEDVAKFLNETGTIYLNEDGKQFGPERQPTRSKLDLDTEIIQSSFFDTHWTPPQTRVITLALLATCIGPICTVGQYAFYAAVAAYEWYKKHKKEKEEKESQPHLFDGEPDKPPAPLPTCAEVQMSLQNPDVRA